MCMCVGACKCVGARLACSRSPSLSLFGCVTVSMIVSLLPLSLSLPVSHTVCCSLRVCLCKSVCLKKCEKHLLDFICSCFIISSILAVLFFFWFKFVVVTKPQHLLIDRGHSEGSGVGFGKCCGVEFGLSVAQITLAIIVLSYIVPWRVLGLLVGLLICLVLLGLCIVFTLQLVGYNCSVFDAHARHILRSQARHAVCANGSCCACSAAWTHKLAVVVLGRLVVVVRRRIGTCWYDPGARA